MTLIYCHTDNETRQNKLLEDIVSFLRLVGGTDFKGAAVKIPKRKLVKEVEPREAKKAPALMEEMARKAIEKLVVEGSATTVRMLLNEHNAIYAMGEHGGLDETKRLMAIRRMLWEVGIQVVSTDEDDELDVYVYGKVIIPKQLLKKFPSLKPHKAVVDCLEF
jgi:hypothetical protein